MINRVVLVGRLTADPELRYTPNGVAVCNFRIAVNRPFTNQQGEREADFLNCVIWRKQAENVSNYLQKGSLAGVDGRMQSRSYENQEGRRVYVVEVQAESVQFLEPKNSQNRPSDNNQQNQQQQEPPANGGTAAGNDQQQTDPFANNGQPIDIRDDDLPF